MNLVTIEFEFEKRMGRKLPSNTYIEMMNKGLDLHSSTNSASKIPWKEKILHAMSS